DSFPGTVEILKRLKKSGYSLYGLSNWSAETFPHARQKYNFFGLLDDIVISGEVGLIKPEPEIFELMLTRIGRPANQCLFIDDALANIEQAQKMGFAVIHFQSSEQLAKELRALNLL
ncbi:MAG: HAD family phosphatase, partial [Chloroflexota bacterium]